jgi:hypothetical protein
VKVAVSILAAAGTFASILAIAAELLRWRMSESRGRTRIAVAVVFLIISVLVGLASMPREPAVSDQEDAVVAADTHVQAPAITVIAAQEERAMRAPKPLPISHTPRSSRPTARSEIMLGERERTMPEVMAAADDALTLLRSRFHTVRGNLRGNQTAPDAALAGLITTDLTLDVKLMDRDGVVLDAFTVTSRGGGFTADASGLQARERLRDALRMRIGKEH